MRAVPLGFGPDLPPVTDRGLMGGDGAKVRHTDSLLAERMAFSSNFIDWNRFSGSGSRHLWIASRMAG